ncbi:MAG: 50S ribosomal protein L17 [Nitrospinae bacterium RIFCSPLOWO2_02_FULL_39_110]|nr:MAG: 50S ribosomal protein L17 [Nitrospinae bacterium RIFCSPHIGHO2_02_39_11]OGV99923.1 MAG: 50S ribosomal protein L17 [Nitrospinae bacterium RIFCSPHIGHO2_12_FULL_39_42]OGW02117.1 MAG: 50S ribosomal protein L17 [Nitrospinae bacterium RIFCSPHIGHO2_02_FULL_39_82]OGW02307.1 MAG: 50S ribosomal protein L17 [Nitrospinae bacterium RIFCSPLOWO2_02_39_17]OGW04664.1 MAG: 50S ribosomal protein L17 [Nitrospinae bacterium RIFCSPLOWO2_02_FULL_39_110]OGW09897.1 MAG: 50S ribosomal protein L17 [Nitrospinae ba
MRHLKQGIKLGRTSAHRKALFRNLVTSLMLYEKIETTLAKAKELRRIADRMVTLGKRGTLSTRRRAAEYIKDKDVLKKIFDVIAKRYAERRGGYTRIYRVGFRKGDAAKLAVIELVDRDISAEPKRRVKPSTKEEKTVKKK